MARTVYDQLTDDEREAVAAIIGGTDCVGFRINLREIPELPGSFTLGEIARAYLLAQLAKLDNGARSEVVDGVATRYGALLAEKRNKDAARGFDQGTEYYIADGIRRAITELLSQCGAGAAA